MAFNPFITLDDNEIGKLAFDYTRHPYIYSTEYGTGTGELFSVDEKTSLKIIKLLQGKDTNIPSKKDKVYVAPGCILPQFRIKEYLKTVGATFTRDITKATLFVGTDSMYEEVDHCHGDNKQARVSKLLFEDTGMWEFDHDKINSNEWYEDADTIHPIELFFKDNNLNKDKHLEILNGQNHDILFSDLLMNNISWNTTVRRRSESDETSGLCYYIYPITMKIIYEILSRKIPVIYEKDFCKDANSGLKLNDPDTFDSIIMMLNSNDNKDREVAIEMICNSDFSDADHQLYKLAKDHYNLRYNSRNKNLDYFMKESNFRHYEQFNDYTFILHLAEEGKLNQKLFAEYLAGFFKECLSGFEYNEFTEMFDFKISLKEDWLKYCTNNKQTQEATYESESKEK